MMAKFQENWKKWSLNISVHLIHRAIEHITHILLNDASTPYCQQVFFFVCLFFDLITQNCSFIDCKECTIKISGGRKFPGKKFPFIMKVKEKKMSPVRGQKNKKIKNKNFILASRAISFFFFFFFFFFFEIKKKKRKKEFLPIKVTKKIPPLSQLPTPPWKFNGVSLIVY